MPGCVELEGEVGAAPQCLVMEEPMVNKDDPRIRGRAERIAELRESVRRAFPAETYAGRITRYDDNLDDPELDEEEYLPEGLKERRWTDVPQQLLENRPDGYLRLTDEAFAAYIAAWLIRSLENIEGENEVRDFVGCFILVQSMIWCPTPQSSLCVGCAL